MILAFTLICPFCGFEFTFDTGRTEDDTDVLDSEMGELFANDQEPKIKYLRSQVRRLYKEKLPIDRVWQLFEKKWGHVAPNAWHKGAVFGNHNSKRGGDTEVNRQRYLNYLHAINPNPKDPFWLKFHIELEFGTATKKAHQHQESQDQQTHRQQNQQQRKKVFSYEDFPKVQHWWDILQVEPTDTKEDIKAAYRKLAMLYHPDSRNMPVDEANEKMKLINFAYEQVQTYFT